MTTPDWTPEDEARFNEMQVRRAIVMTERKAPVLQLAQKLEMRLDEVNNGNKDDVWDFNTLADWFIANVDEIRDALESFDSGVREET